MPHSDPLSHMRARCSKESGPGELNDVHIYSRCINVVAARYYVSTVMSFVDGLGLV